jgi:hypothetical protein
LCPRRKDANEGSGTVKEIRSMRVVPCILAIGIGLAKLSITMAVVPSGAKAPVIPKEAVGLWQFPDRTVWVRIAANGETFQCRVAPKGTIYRSEGKFVTSDTIQWRRETWGIDRVSLRDGGMTLSGKWEFTYQRSVDPMDGRCLGK